MLTISRIVAASYIFATIVLAVITVVYGPIGWAPLPLPTAAPPIRIDLAISSEKEDWIRSAIERFALTNPTVNGRAIEVRVRIAGSRELIELIERGSYQPTAVSPASVLQLNELRQWRPEFLTEPAQSLVLSPIVVLVRESAATDSVVDPWRAIQDNNLKVKIGISAPTRSNGGLQTILLLAAQYHRSDNLTREQARDPALQDWLANLDRRVVQWPASTGMLTTDFIIRPGVYDIITTYENLALQSFRQGEGRGLRIRIHYPPITTVSDHPYTILNAPWVDSAEREAARLLGNFLLSPDEQRIAMRQYGFRPANPQVTVNLTDAESLFGRYADRGLQIDLAAQLATPTPDVVTELLNTWRSATGQ
ncbi:substrate-binding domain-containing protein [Chloroflexus sp.]|uniref:substrate-binding domain-containing protein n=1 Tax=Chloroflexus sp. TaxID=1904827 RepID=UPI002616235B|nr:substrate-binding domain-containing protein [uncultured Chloroflexus sp.]